MALGPMTSAPCIPSSLTRTNDPAKFQGSKAEGREALHETELESNGELEWRDTEQRVKLCKQLVDKCFISG